MSTATLIIGPALDVVQNWTRDRVQSVITSPPYWRKRDYLDAADPAKVDEWGQEDSPALFLDHLLDLTDALWDVVADDGTIWFNLGDTAGGSGGWGGDVATVNRGGGTRWKGTSAAGVTGMVRDKSVCWLPDLFGASLAYGWNMLRPERRCRRWITRPPVTWCKPNPTPGEIIDKFREATELFVWASKQPKYYFDLDAVRVPSSDNTHQRTAKGVTSRPNTLKVRGNRASLAILGETAETVPPLNWWPIAGSGYDGAHFATFPPELIIRPVIVSCPPGGTILDPFVGSGTTLAVATGHGRNAIGIDLDRRNVPLVEQRVGMFLAEVSS